MGYTTDFKGKLWLNRPLEENHRIYLVKFNDTRRMKRNSDLLPPDPFAQAVGLGFGEEGEYFVAATGYAGQDSDDSILNYNNPPKTQPGLWCKWIPNEKGTAIIWDGAEKFYGYVEWLEYLNDHFLKPWGYLLDGSIIWQGEDKEDYGTIVCDNSVIAAYEERRFHKPKKVGYGGMTKRVLKEKPVVLYDENIYSVIASVYSALKHAGKEWLAEEYHSRIYLIDPDSFWKITKEYVKIEK